MNDNLKIIKDLIANNFNHTPTLGEFFANREVLKVVPNTAVLRKMLGKSIANTNFNMWNTINSVESVPLGACLIDPNSQTNIVIAEGLTEQIYSVDESTYFSYTAMLSVPVGEDLFDGGEYYENNGNIINLRKVHKVSFEIGSELTSYAGFLEGCKFNGMTFDRNNTPFSVNGNTTTLDIIKANRLVENPSTNPTMYVTIGLKSLSRMESYTTNVYIEYMNDCNKGDPYTITLGIDEPTMVLKNAK